MTETMNWKKHLDINPWQTLLVALVLGFAIVAIIMEAIVAVQLHDENQRLKQQTHQRP